ncbi:MAG: hypothetical protein KF742_01775 [Cryobacterium sp.]|nr:hypothetical protein [Cryobacterium sp.]
MANVGNECWFVVPMNVQACSIHRQSRQILWDVSVCRIEHGVEMLLRRMRAPHKLHHGAIHDDDESGIWTLPLANEHRDGISVAVL